MASISTSKLLLLLICYVSLIFFVSSSSSSSDLPSSPKVSLGLYYESLCPYCSSFIVNHLTKLFEDDLISIVDLHLSPWGNTKLRSDNVTAVCQVFSHLSDLSDLIKLELQFVLCCCLNLRSRFVIMHDCSDYIKHCR